MMMDAFVLVVLHTFKIATVSYTVISTYEGKFDSPSHAVSHHMYVRKTSQLSLGMMDAFVLLVLHTFNIATVSYSVNLCSVRITRSSVCMSRAVPTMFITVAQLDAVTQEVSRVRW